LSVMLLTLNCNENRLLTLYFAIASYRT
jgi:hypothetical protein